MGASAMYLAEFLGTALLLLLGNGINMTLSLKRSFGKGGGWIATCFGWGLAVTISAYLTGWVSGAHLNPAVTIAMAFKGDMSWALVPGYIIAQMLGAMLGATLAYLTYKDLMDLEEDAGTKLGVFATGPAVDNKPWNVVTELIGTFILLLGIFAINQTENGVGSGMGPYLVGMLICVIGLSTGGATGFAINPARDLGPRIAHAILPIKGKGGSNWGYAWVPTVGPIVGAVLAVVVYNFFRGFIQ